MQEATYKSGDRQVAPEARNARVGIARNSQRLLGSELVRAESRAAGEHEALAKAVDQAGAVEPAE